MKFQIEQVAICPLDPQRAIALLEDMEAVNWTSDTVKAHGSVHGREEERSIGFLNFNYELLKNAREFEVLHYDAESNNWMRARAPRVSHLGMHCSEEELDRWKEFFRTRGILIAQELWTDSHTNPMIRDKRKYHYCIFDTYDILSVDLKFIVREELGM